MKHCLVTLTITILLAVTIPVKLSAQETLPGQLPYIHYFTGKDLLDKNNFSSAYNAFDRYIRLGDDPVLIANARYYKAYSAMELFNDETETLFRDFIDRHPYHNKKHPAHFNLGKYHFRNEEFSKAIPWLSKSDPHYLDDDDWAEWHFMSGYCWFRQDRLQEAREFFSKIKDYDNPFWADANYYYAFISMEKDDLRTAASHLSKIDRSSRYDSVVPAYLTQVLVNLGRYDEAIAYAETRLEDRQPGNIHLIYRAIGQAYYFEEQYDKVIEQFEAVPEGTLLTDKENYFWGFAYLSEGQPEQAVNRMERINFGADSTSQNMAFHYAQALEATGDLLQAKNAFEMASESEHDTEIQKRSAFNAAVLAYELDFQKEAIERFRNFAEAFQGTDLANQAQGYLGEILLATRNYRQALEIIEELPERSPEMDRSYQQIAYYFALNNYKNGSYTRASTYFEKALNTPVNDVFTAKATFWLGETNYLTGNYDEANRHYWNFAQDPAAQETPYYNLIHYNLAYSFFQQEEYEDAITRFRQFINTAEQEGSDTEKIADARLRLADSYFGVRSFEEAYRQYQNYTEQYDVNADYALYQKGTIAGLQNRHQQKLNHLATLRDEHPTSEYMEHALFEIAEVYFIRRNYPVALNHFSYLAQEYPESPYNRLARLKIGLIKYNQENDDEAASVLKELASASPHSQEAREALNILRNIYIEQGKEDSLFAFIETLPGIELTASMQDSVLYESALNEWQRRDYEAAFNRFNRYTDEFPEGFFYLNARHYLAESAWRTGKREEAYESFKKIIEMQPNQFVSNAAAKSAEWAQQQGDHENAYRYYDLYRQNVTEKSNRIAALKGMTVSAYESGNYRDAIRHATAIIETSDIEPDDKVYASYFAGKSYQAIGESDNALEAYAEVYKTGRGEKGAEALYESASINLEKGELNKTQELVYKLREEFAIYDHYVAKGFILLGEVFLKRENFHQARHTLKSVINNHSDEEILALAEDKLHEVNAAEEAANVTE